jgi:peptidoglycan-associated lipoprotein
MRVYLLFLAALLVAGCQTSQIREESKAVPGTGPKIEERRLGDDPATAKPTEVDVSGRPLSAAAGAAVLRDPNNILSKRSVYFEIDSSVVADKFKPLIQAHAKYLVDTKNAKILIQGNCDETGSREYNIALGQRRADAVRQMLMVLGAQEHQIESVSLGKEKPRALGRTPEADAENRRSDLLYQGEY